MNVPKLEKCRCGTRPAITRFCGWWHIECPTCGFRTKEPMGCTWVWGYNTRREATGAWNAAINKPA